MSNDRPVIYLLESSVAVTGALICAGQQARALEEKARIVMVLPEGHQVPEQHLQHFWRVETIPMFAPSKRFGALLQYFPALISGSIKLKRLMKADGCTTLQLNDFYLMQGPMLRWLGYRGRMVCWLRCDPYKMMGGIAGYLLALNAKASNRMVAVSHYVKNLLPSAYDAAVCYDYYEGKGSLRQLQEGSAKKLLFIGNYISGKGQDVALEAFAIAAPNDASLRLDFYGSDMGLAKNRAYKENLLELCKALGLEKRVTFHEFLENKDEVLARSYAALNASSTESFSMTVLEASGAGLPVVATASGGPQEILLDGETGFLVPVRDAEAMAARIIELAENPDLAQRMSEAGAKRVQEKFSKEAFIQMVMPLLDLR